MIIIRGNKGRYPHKFRLFSGNLWELCLMGQIQAVHKDALRKDFLLPQR